MIETDIVRWIPRKLKKKLVPILLVLAMVASMIPCTVAAEENEAAVAAENLHVLGLFQGTGTDADGRPIFDLDKGVTRAEAVTMLVRLLGKDWEAKNTTWEVPFQDVPAWAVPYVGYAYANGLAKGTGGNTFSAANPVSAQDYLTLLLRALQYREEAGEFSWARASETTDLVGLTHGDYSDNRALTRGDVATLSFRVLSCGQNRTGTALIRTLYDNGAVYYDHLEFVGLSAVSGLETLAAPTNFRVKDDPEHFTMMWDNTYSGNVVYVYMSQISNGPYYHIATVADNEFVVESTDKYSFDDMQYCYLRFRYAQLDDRDRPESVSPFAQITVTFLKIIPVERLQEINQYYYNAGTAFINALDMMGNSSNADTAYYRMFYVQKAQEYYDQAASNIGQMIRLSSGYDGTEELISTLEEMQEIARYNADYFVSAYNYVDFIKGEIQADEKFVDDLGKVRDILNGIMEQWNSIDFK